MCDDNYINIHLVDLIAYDVLLIVFRSDCDNTLIMLEELGIMNSSSYFALHFAVECYSDAFNYFSNDMSKFNTLKR